MICSALLIVFYFHNLLRRNCQQNSEKVCMHAWYERGWVMHHQKLHPLKIIHGRICRKEHQYWYNLKKNICTGIPIVVQQKWNWNWLVSMRLWVWSLALLSELRIWHCCELRCSLQGWLGCGVATTVAVAGNCSSDSTPSLGISICYGCSPKKKKKKKAQMSFLSFLPCNLIDSLLFKGFS